jgi:hypothetical protein
MIRAPGLSVPASLMRPRRAVFQTPPKSSVPPRLPFYKGYPPPTHAKSTLLQLLIPFHFNSPRISVYKEPGRGSLLSARKVYNSSLLPCRLCSPANRLPGESPGASSRFSLQPFNFKPSTFNRFPLTPFPATLTADSQLAQNPATLPLHLSLLRLASNISPLSATLTKKHRGWGGLTLSSHAVSR